MRQSFTQASIRIQYTNIERRVVMEDNPMTGRGPVTIEVDQPRETVVHLIRVASGHARGTVRLKGVQGELGGPDTWVEPRIKRTFDLNDSFHSNPVRK